MTQELAANIESATTVEGALDLWGECTEVYDGLGKKALEKALSLANTPADVEMVWNTITAALSTGFEYRVAYRAIIVRADEIEKVPA